MKNQNLIQVIIGLTIFLLGNSAFAIKANTDLVLNKISQDGNNIVISVDIDNPSNQNVSSVQSWLEFDKDKVNCKGINTDDSKFDFVVPGESNIVGNIIKIGRSSLSGDIAGNKINVAKINCELLKDGGEIRFHDYKTDGGKVSIMVFENGFPINTLKGEPKSIKFEMEKTGENEEVKNNKNSGNIKNENNGKLNRPSGLKIDTKIGSAILAWNKTEGAVKYYIYYGKISGNYLKRRLVGDNTIYELGGLETGGQYYFAITAVGKGNSESDYSNEEAIIIGKKLTSTSPLYKKTKNNFKKINYTADINNVLSDDAKNAMNNAGNAMNDILKNIINENIQNKNIKNNVQTGPAETALLVLILSFMIGVFAYRKKIFPVNS